MAKRGNKFGNVNPKFMILGGAIVVIILVVTLYYVYKQPSTPEVIYKEAEVVAQEQAPLPAPPPPDVVISPIEVPKVTPPPPPQPSIQMIMNPIEIPGWYGNYGASIVFDTYQENPHVDYTVRSCGIEAKKRGADMFTVRKDNHPVKEYRSTCFGFNSTPDIINFKGDLLDRNEHITACSDPLKTWPNCK